MVAPTHEYDDKTDCFAFHRDYRGFMFWTPWLVGRISWNRHGRFGGNGRRFWIFTSRTHWEWENENLL